MRHTRTSLIIIIIVKKALAELVYWHPVQARFSLRTSLKVFRRQARLPTHLKANFKTQIDRVECLTEVVWYMPDPVSSPRLRLVIAPKLKSHIK
jgi:hypothetical protein